MSSIRHLSTEEIRKHYAYDSEDKQHYESWGFEFDRWLAEVKIASMTSERNHLVRLVEHEQEVMRKAGGATFGKRKEYDEGYNMALRDIRGILERG